MKYYKNSDAERFQHITSAKLKLHNHQSFKQYLWWLLVALIVVVLFPLTQILFAQLKIQDHISYIIISLLFSFSVPLGSFLVYRLFKDKFKGQELKPYVLRPQVIIFIFVTSVIYFFLLSIYIACSIFFEINPITNRPIITKLVMEVDDIEKLEVDFEKNLSNEVKIKIAKRFEQDSILSSIKNLELNNSNLINAILSYKNQNRKYHIGQKIFVPLDDGQSIVLRIRYHSYWYSIYDLLLTSVPTFFNSYLSMWLYTLLIFIPLLIKNRLRKNNDYNYLYYRQFLRAIVFTDLNFLIGSVLFITLSFIPGFLVLFGQKELMSSHLLRGIAFYSFWSSALIWSILPALKGYFKLGDTLHSHSIHIVNHQIIPFLENHLVIIGTGNLGALLIKSCFFDIHPEGYEISTICNCDDPRNDKIIDDFSDYQVIIDKNLELYLVSTRMIIIDSNKAHFKEFLDSEKDFPIGLIPPGTPNPKFKGVMVLGICGDAMNRFVLNAARADYAQLIINSTPNNKLSYKLALDLRQKTKSILSINDIPSFDNLTSFTYDQPTYLIDTKLIEAVTISQRIVIWILKYLINSSQDIINLADSEGSKLLHNINEKYPKVLIVGRGKIIHYIVQTLLLIQNVEVIGLFQKFPQAKSYLENKLKHIYGNTQPIDDQKLVLYLTKIIAKLHLLLMTDCNFIRKELEKIKPELEFQSTNWKFYPIRMHSTIPDLDEISIHTYLCETSNFEHYLKVLKYEKPNLAVLISDKEYDSASMFIKLTNALEIVKNRADYKDYNLSILSYSHRFDKYFLDDQIKKYFIYNLQGKEIQGFPSQLTKESLIARDYVTANQFASMIRSLYELKNDEESEKDRIVGEITCALYDEPIAIASTICKMNGMKITPSLIENETIIPSFIFGYSFDERRYKNTFIFTGTAKPVYINKNSQATKGTVLINCDRKSVIFYNDLFNKNLKCEHGDISSIDEPGMFKDCPITTTIRHKNKHNDLNINQRLFEFYYDGYRTQASKDKSIFSNYAHYKIWADARYPGSMAEALANVVLHKVENIKLDERSDWLPFICFSTSSPYSRIATELRNKGRLHIYSKLWNEAEFRKNHPDKTSPDNVGRSVEDRNERFNAGIINAIKIKLGEDIKSQTERANDDYGWFKWFEYTLKLKNHLDSIYKKFGYNLYIIKKFYIEGKINVELQKSDKNRCVEFSEYYQIKTLSGLNNFLNKVTPDFCIGSCQKISNQDDIVSLRNDEDITSKEKKIIDQFFSLKNCFTNISNEMAQQYELVIIRNDIVNGAKDEYEQQKNNYETHEEAESRKFQNMLFFIENL